MFFIKNVIKVITSNIATIVGGLVIGFLIPKLMTVSDYGYYKTYTLYLSYAGLCSLGLIDGIVLKYGGFDYVDLDSNNFSVYYKSYLLIHLFFSFIILIVSAVVEDINLRIILIMLSINLVLHNSIGYFQQISQITQRFDEYSRIKILQTFLDIVLVFVLLYVNTKGILIRYYTYIFAIVIINGLLTLWYLYRYRSIIFVKKTSKVKHRKDIYELVCCGFPLLLGNLCSIMILSLDRQFVNVMFSTSEYAIYSFAYSMLSLVTVATSAVSTVLFPFLKRMKDDSYANSYDFALSFFTITVYILVSSYFPLTIFINWFLPKYRESLSIFRIIIPAVSISSSITVVSHNFYKSVNRNNLYFVYCVSILFISFIANYIAYTICKTMESISLASVATVFIWYFVVNIGIKDKCKTNIIKNMVYIVVVSATFYMSSMLKDTMIGMVVYLLGFLVFTILFYKPHIKKAIRVIKNRL